MVVNNKVVMENIMNYTLYDDIDMEDRLFVSWSMFEEASGALFEAIKDLQKKTKFNGIYGVPKGGIVLAVKLSYLTGLQLVTDPEKISDDVLVVDDCTKTGKTLSKYEGNSRVVMFHNPDACFKPDFYFMKTRKQINFCWESMDERN
jgi:hypoxanthine phosphoribosyltransferase